jgi:endogenous inhibitor of DNA gyrase (YacG/DUF329 family)
MQVLSLIACPDCGARYLGIPGVVCPKCNGEGAAVSRSLSENNPRLPVCGWLVYAGTTQVIRLTDGKNYIFERDTVNNTAGRDLTRANAIIIFDDETSQFWLINGIGRNVVRINGRLLLTPERLQKNDVITVSGTNMMFKPFCSERFRWADYQSVAES